MSPTPRSAVASGRRDRWVYLVPITEGQGSSGFPLETDEPQENWIGLWAGREDVGGRERFMANQITAPFDVTWRLPFGEAFDPDTVDVPKRFALSHKGRRYDIVAAAVIGRGDGVELFTMSGGLQQ